MSVIVKATCPTSPDHKKFCAVAVVRQTWIIDENGNRLSERDVIGTVKSARESDFWCCIECGSVADVKRKKG